MESQLKSSTAEYTLLNNTVEGRWIADNNPYRSRYSYPGNRRRVAAGDPPLDSVLIKTGGNALQAAPRSVVERSNNNAQNLMSVSVPHNMSPGNQLLVATPDGTNRVIEATIPPGTFPGHTFLVEIPPIEGTLAVATGVPTVEDVSAPTFRGDGTQIVTGHDIEHTDLHLQVAVASSSSSSSASSDTEMVRDSNQREHREPSAAANNDIPKVNNNKQELL